MGADQDETNPKSRLRGHWRASEDAKLRQLVEQFGPHNWNSIAEKLQGRSGKSCRLRWFNQLDPKINRRPFTKEEEERLLAAQRVHGNKWALMAGLFPGRTDNAIKNHWHVITARRRRELSIKRNFCNHHLLTSSLVPHDLFLLSPPSSTSRSSPFLLQNLGGRQTTISNARLSNGDSCDSGDNFGGLEDNSARLMNIGRQNEDGGEESRREDVTFIDFLGVGMTS